MTKHLFPSNPIMIVDDEQPVLDGFEIALYSAGLNNVVTCADSREVIVRLQERRFELLLLDLIMPHISGEQLILDVKKAFPNLPVIVITAVGEIDTVVECMRSGAVDYILKPVEKSQLCSRVRQALEFKELEKENAIMSERLLYNSLHNPEIFSSIITQNKKMRSIFQYCESVAGSMRPILITGETGTGKELIARAIHELSGRQGEFVTVNIAACDDPVVADVLFGHVRGAFTGADHPRQGLVCKATGGTLFLDEIGDLSMASQVKLLRLLQEREYSPVGSDAIKNTNIRVVASTHRDLGKLRHEGRFRDDLYYRLFSHHVHLPPLRKRIDDIRLLLDHFLARISKELGKKKPTYHPELVTLLKAYTFPGNIRELKAIIGDAIAQHQSRMLSSKVFKEYMHLESTNNLCAARENRSLDIFKDIRFNEEELPSLKVATEKITELLIKAAMEKAQNNQTVAARILDISQQSLSNKIQKIKNNK